MSTTRRTFPTERSMPLTGSTVTSRQFWHWLAHELPLRSNRTFAAELTPKQAHFAPDSKGGFKVEVQQKR
ncbi:MAG: hypothetical protein VB131_03800, partial [Burkholderia gladioli]